MIGAGDLAPFALGHSGHDGLLILIVDQRLEPGPQHQHRQVQRRDPRVALEPGRGGKGEVQPAPRPGAQPHIRTGRQLRQGAGIAAGVMGQDVAVERTAVGIARLVQDIVGALQAGHQPGQGPRRRLRPAGRQQAHHRSRQEGADKTLRLALGQGQGGQAAAHRMTDRQPGPGHAIGEMVYQRAIVGHEVAESYRMALQPVRQQPVGKTLPAPVMDHDNEAALHQLGHDLVVFLDRLGPAGAQHHRAPRLSFRGEYRRAQPGPAHPLEPLGLAAGRDRGLGNVEQGGVDVHFLGRSSSSMRLGARASLRVTMPGISSGS